MKLIRGDGVFGIGLKIFPVVGHIPVEILLAMNCFLDAASTSHKIF